MSKNGVTKNGHKRYEVPLRTAKLVFEGDYEGAEVRCHLDVPLGLVLEYAALVESSDPEKHKAAHERFSREVLLDWNLSIDGEEVPAHPDGMLRIPTSLAKAIFKVWFERARDDAPLGART